MARAGEVIENPVSGERFTFLKTASDTGGELLQFELGLRPGGRVPADHIHARQEERFHVVSGAVRVRLSDEERDLRTGESVVVPSGTPHVVRNESAEAALLIVELRPAMNAETFLETICGLAQAGKVGRRGLPNPLRLAVIARRLGVEDYLPGVPIAVQKVGLAAMAPLGRLLGYRGEYPEYGGSTE